MRYCYNYTVERLLCESVRLCTILTDPDEPDI